ncbi:MAG TPA: response regulator transcription factor [Terriglobales bacterium]|nr:response regulator transcription factor [Terriglobales bacterium]
MRAKILIADDHASVRRSLKAVLEQTGEFQVCCEAKDGLEAVELAKRHHPDVVILDLLMPNLNGFNAAKAISSSLPNVPIVLHTMYGGAAVEREAKKYGVDAVVPKLGSQDWRSVIEEFLDAPQDTSTGG